MKIVSCIQGTMEWFDARLGKPTASRFSDIVTPTGKAVAGKTRRTYMLDLLAERLTGKVGEHYVSAAMQRGTELEPRARAWYELTSGRSVQQVGVVLRDDGRSGASPDGLMPERGLEIKCLGRAAHLDAILRGIPEPDHWLQCQAGMWVCERNVWDYVLFTDEPGLPNEIITVERDPEICKAFDEVVPAFCDMLDEFEKALRDKGAGVDMAVYESIRDNSAGIMED